MSSLFVPAPSEPNIIFLRTEAFYEGFTSGEERFWLFLAVLGTFCLLRRSFLILLSLFPRDYLFKSWAIKSMALSSTFTSAYFLSELVPSSSKSTSIASYSLSD